MYDLQRLKRDVNRTDVLPDAPSVLLIPAIKTIAPIPREDIEIMGLHQNDGYL